MKILHVWSNAGVGNLLAKHQRLLGHEVTVIMPAQSDYFDYFEYYGDQTVKLDVVPFLNHCVEMAKDFDIVHVHSMAGIILKLRARYPDFKQKIIMHYHGSDVRNNIINHKALQTSGMVDMFLVATPDLQYYGTYLPTPIDTEMFNKSGLGQGMLAINNGGDALNDWLAEHGVKPRDIFYRPILHYKHVEMPAILHSYESYLDVKFAKGNPMSVRSKTGLEALASGLTVVDYRLREFKGLPAEHRAENVVKLLESLMSDLA